MLRNLQSNLRVPTSCSSDAFSFNLLVSGLVFVGDLLSSEGISDSLHILDCRGPDAQRSQDLNFANIRPLDPHQWVGRLWASKHSEPSLDLLSQKGFGNSESKKTRRYFHNRGPHHSLFHLDDYS